MARPVRFSFLRGGGSSLEVLYGKVSLTPTNLHTLSSTAVLPAPTSFDLVNGTALATNVAPTPAPVDGTIAWAYKVKITDNFGKTWEYLVGVPDGTSEINFNVLPRYSESRPPAFGVGPAGPAGQSATIAIGNTTSGATPAVTNTGTSTDAVLNFQLPKGDKGDTGVGVPSGGTALQVVRKNAANTTTEWTTLDKSLVGLANVDNTSDADKPVSGPQQTALNGLEGRTDANVAGLVIDDHSDTQEALRGLFVARDNSFVSLRDFGAVGDGVADDTEAWDAFQAYVGLRIVLPGRYLVRGEIRRFDLGVLGNGDFDDDSATWDQVKGDRERDSIIVHRNDVDVNTHLLSPIIKTQTHTNFTADVPIGSFKRMVGAYHEATYDGYYNTRLDTNQNFTLSGLSVFNRMAGMFGGLGQIIYAKDATEEENPLIETMGASKNGCAFFQFTRRSRYENGGYMFGLEVYAQNQANETLAVPYQNNDEFNFTTWTAGIKLAGNSSGAPTSAALFTHGLSGAGHGFWNGLVLGATSFKINGDNQGVPGTIGINMAGWRTSAGYADIGIKFRTANRHLYFREGAKIRTSLTRFMNDAGAAGLSLEAGSGSNPYMHFRTGVTDAPDGGATVLQGQIDVNSSWTRLQSSTGEIHLAANSGDATYVANSARFAPATANDGVLHLGAPTRRWNTIYAVNGVIETSDERAKTDIDNIPDAALDAWGRVNFQQYRIKDAVATKDGTARLHTGVIAQRVVEAFQAEGLDATDYGLLCYDEWEAAPEEVHEYQTETTPAVFEQILAKEAVYRDEEQADGSSITVEVVPPEYVDGELLEPADVETHRTVTPAVEAGSLYGIRYEEALCFEAAYQRRRSDLLEERIARLESLITA